LAPVRSQVAAAMWPSNKVDPWLTRVSKVPTTKAMRKAVEKVAPLAIRIQASIGVSQVGWGSLYRRFPGGVGVSHLDQ